ncbi:PIN-like domain-containing protein [Streptosporangium sp. NPDC006007]|uniref:PIN-like domain-containing protein n=1 Tax=Streptosporangium sp. NPDC006007 TaxID=3154575 RepID=UPI0033B11CB6
MESINSAADQSLNHESASNSLRQLFPGYFPPGDKDLEVFIKEGLVAFDTNALFDIYRFSIRARSEFSSALKLLGERLWIPNRVGQEILDLRLEVIRECAEANEVFDGELRKSFDISLKQIRNFGNRRGLTKRQVSLLEDIANRAFRNISSQADSFFDFDLNVDESIRDDKILIDLEKIIEGKIGKSLDNLKAEEVEGARRIAEKIPPGYADHKKDSQKAVGDYILWRQLLIEAASRAKPVLLVTNDQKPDWVREVSGRKIGPRPELVAEMLQVAGVPFHLITVKSFLLLAQEYLGAEVSATTVTQAQQFSGMKPGENRGYIYVSSIKAALVAAGWGAYEGNWDLFPDLLVETDFGRIDLIVKAYGDAPIPFEVVNQLIGYAERTSWIKIVLVSQSRLTRKAYKDLVESENIGFIHWNSSDGGEVLCRQLAEEFYRLGSRRD